MIKNKKIFASALVAGILWCGMPSCDIVNASPQDYGRQEDSTVNRPTPDKKKGDTIDIGSNSPFKQITDNTGTISKEKMDSISSELDAIYKELPQEFGEYKMYTFLYNSKSKKPADVLGELVATNQLSGLAKPIIFVFNTETKSFIFGMDERIASYTPCDFYLSLANKTLASKEKATAEDIEEFLVRSNSMFVLNRKKEMPKAEIPVADSKFIKVIDFSNQASSDSKSNENKDEDEGKQKDVKVDDSWKTFLASILFAFAAIVAVFYRKKKAKK